jgi:Tfp pilus assembly protein PilN
VRAVNLLPREATRRRKRPAVVVQLAVLAPFVVGSLLAAGYLLANSKVNDNKATLQVLSDDLATLPIPSAPQTDSGLAVQRDQRVAALASALQGRVAWDRILREVSSVLPEDAWLTDLSAESPQLPAAAPTPTDTTADTTATTTTSSDSGDGAAAAPPVVPATAPLRLDGYTYSQEGVARFLSRLAVIPDLQDVKLIQSTQTIVAARTVVSFQIQASVRPQATA